MAESAEAAVKRTFYEFFAGGGMARAGLGSDWRCLFANDFDPKKAATYRENWGADDLVEGDVARLTIRDLPGKPDLVWASSPCQDVSLAGDGAGLSGSRSSAFWPFWNLMEGLVADGRAPAIIALENVCGLLTSHKGADFEAVIDAYCGLGYRVGAMVIDAELFLPQSRPRLFVVGVRKDVPIPQHLIGLDSRFGWGDRKIRDAYLRLPDALQVNWVRWKIETQPKRNIALIDLIEDDCVGMRWHSEEQTQNLLSMMTPLNLRKVETAKAAKNRTVGTIYKRTRPDGTGGRRQRAEVRFDDVAGCLRTPAGGSSRQLIMVVEGGRVRTRLISARETARLMGLPDDYRLPERYNEAYHLTGDGVAVPVVSFLSNEIFRAVTRKAEAVSEVAA